MRRLPLIMTLSLLASLAASSAWSRPLSRSADIHRPFDQVYASVSKYFSPDSRHDFQIVSQNRSKSKAEFVAKRIVQDKMKWSDWAYCEVPTLQLFDTLQQGNITVTVELERESAGHTYVTVTPDFEGVYQFAGNSRTQQCASKGGLENDILRGAGASASDLN
jgi:hypothetical protein